MVLTGSTINVAIFLTVISIILCHQWQSCLDVKYLNLDRDDPVQKRIQNPPSRASNMELLGKIANGWKPFTVFAKIPILDGWLGSEYTSAVKHLWTFFVKIALGEKYRNTEFFLVRIFLYSDWIQKLRIWTLFTQSYTWLDFTCIFCHTWWKCKLYIRSLFTDIRGPLTANCLIYDAIENILLEVITLKSFWIDFSPLWIVINCNAIRFKNRFFSEKSKKSIFGSTLYVSFFFFWTLWVPVSSGQHQN